MGRKWLYAPLKYLFERMHAVKKSILYLLIFILAGCTFLLGYYVGNTEIQRKDGNTQSSLEEFDTVFNCQQTDDYNLDETIVMANHVLYKLFYGKWEITSVIEGKNFNEENVGKYIGRIVEYREDCISVDGEEVISVPIYAYGIIPIDEYVDFSCGYAPNENFMNMESDYFVYVWVETCLYGEYNPEDKVFKNFYIINDDMLVLDTYDGYYIMERIEHIEDYEIEVTYQDYYW